MTLRRIHCKTERTPEETVRLRADRERYQRERPTPEQLLAEGGRAEFVQLGELLLLHQVTAWLRAERERQHRTLAELADATGIDQAALSRLETGQNANPTLDTLCRVAGALGKTICCTLRDTAELPPAVRPSGKRKQAGRKTAASERPAAHPDSDKAHAGKAT